MTTVDQPFLRPAEGDGRNTQEPDRIQPEPGWRTAAAANSFSLRGGKLVSAPAAMVLIEPRGLNRECLVRYLNTVSDHPIRGFASVASWIAQMRPDEAAEDVCLVILSLERVGPDCFDDQLAELARHGIRAPIVTLSDKLDAGWVIEILGKGVKGVISQDIALDVAVQAMRLVIAGGVFIPADCLLVANGQQAAAIPKPASEANTFTSRQAAVVDLLRKGKSNKIIAHELGMRESTVKVHVRNIMKRLNAHNRTEVAYLTTKQGGGADDHPLPSGPAVDRRVRVQLASGSLELKPVDGSRIAQR